MASDYEKVYQSTKHALGKPTSEFVKYFSSYGKNRANVLDIGCGQGRDALFIARLGHSVRGVDLSPSGIRDLLEEAKTEGLNITGDIADIRFYTPREKYDAIVIDRTLHMLSPEDRIKVLRKLPGFLQEQGVLLIADEPSNIPALHAVFDELASNWSVLLKRRGFLFLQHQK